MQRSQMNLFFQAFTDLLNRVRARQTIDWLLPNSHFSKSELVFEHPFLPVSLL